MLFAHRSSLAARTVFKQTAQSLQGFLPSWSDHFIASNCFIKRFVTKLPFEKTPIQPRPTPPVHAQEQQSTVVPDKEKSACLGQRVSNNFLCHSPQISNEFTFKIFIKGDISFFCSIGCPVTLKILRFQIAEPLGER